MSDYLEQRRRMKLFGKQSPDKKVYTIPKKSAKKLAEEKKEKELRGTDDTMKEKWFHARRKEMKGVCACGCKQPSSKKDDKNFRSSCCHIFPQRLFESVALHKLNFVERAFFVTTESSCHTNMDNRSMELWTTFADWQDIREKFFILAPLLTDEERAQKFYTQLEKLVYSKK